ncbi:hypothetical protein COOONC_14968 [Cooperia oncophora]
MTTELATTTVAPTEAEVPGEIAKILFGRHDSASFVGCVGDVSYNGELLDFAKAKIHEVSLTGCSLAADLVKTTMATTKQTETSETVPTTPEVRFISFMSPKVEDAFHADQWGGVA